MNEIQLDQDMTSLMIELNSFESPIKKTFQVLGMTLTNVTPEINEAYELERNETWGMGVMIVDPGNDFERFEIGEVRAGDVFWMVGNEQVNYLGEFVTQLGGEARSPSSPPESGGNTSAIVFPDGSARVRVVYSTDRETGRYSNTQYMRLEPKDIAALNSLPSTDR